MSMVKMLNRLYRVLTRPLQDRWLGGLHAGLVIKGLYLQWMVASFLGQGHKRVLDAGCGPEAQLVAMLAGRYPTCTFSGLDLHLSREGRRRDRHPENLAVLEADLASLNEVERYDLIYSIDVLEHIYDYADVLDRLVKALRPSGLLFIHVPSAEQCTWFKATEAEPTNDFREHRTGDDHVREGFDKAALISDLEDRSVSVVEARWTFNGVTSWFKEVFSLGERRRVQGIGLLLLPVVVLSVVGEMLIAPRRGNGVCVLGVRKGVGVQ
jgi:2-polyprenyl-3-methyl-5-hydroxy-6-metoxy-1,4-benzoquinol methylase